MIDRKTIPTWNCTSFLAFDESRCIMSEAKTVDGLIKRVMDKANKSLSSMLQSLPEVSEKDEKSIVWRDTPEGFVVIRESVGRDGMSVAVESVPLILMGMVKSICDLAKDYATDEALENPDDWPANYTNVMLSDKITCGMVGLETSQPLCEAVKAVGFAILAEQEEAEYHCDGVAEEKLTGWLANNAFSAVAKSAGYGISRSRFGGFVQVRFREAVKAVKPSSKAKAKQTASVKFGK